MAEANVQSIETLEAFSDSLARLRDATQRNAEAIREQLQRVDTWLNHELPEYWGNQRRIAQRRWGEARDELLQCQARPRAEDETSCLSQKKALERAAARLDLCEKRMRLLEVLVVQWEQMSQQCLLSARQLDDLAETGFPVSVSRLQQALQILRQYLGSHSDEPR